MKTTASPPLAVYADCIKNGVTTRVRPPRETFFDVPGSHDDIASAATALGVRASLCYEVSDRDGAKKAEESVLENERFILRTQAEGSDMLQGMMGLHASFTVSDETLRLCERHRHGAGYHVHCAEGPADLAHCLKTYGKRIIERFYDAGVLGDHTLAIHCVTSTAPRCSCSATPAPWSCTTRNRTWATPSAAARCCTCSARA